MNPGEVGMSILDAFRTGSAEREKREYRSVLSGYAMNPTEEGLAGLAPYNPEFVIQERGRLAESQNAARKQQQADAGTFRKLLKQASESPEGWMQAYGAGRQLGLDMSGVPAEYDPQWAQQQLFIMDAIEGESETLSGMAKELVDAGLDPTSDEFKKAMMAGFEGKYSSEYVDQQGNTRRRSVFGRPVQPSPQAIEALRNGAGTPEQFDAMFGPGSAKRILGEGGAGATRVGNNFLGGL